MSLLLFLLFLAHALAAQVAGFAPIVAAHVQWRGRHDEDSGGLRAARGLVIDALALMLATALLGMSLGYLRWRSNEGYALALAFLNRRIYWAIAEFLFSISLLVGYLFLVRSPQDQPSIRSWRQCGFWGPFLLVLAATNLLYHFPLLMTAFGQAVSIGQLDTLSTTAPKELLFSIATLTKSLHFVLAAPIATYIWSVFRGSDPRVTDVLSRWILGLIVLEMAVGFWLLLQLPAWERNQLLGSDPLSLALLGLGVVSGFLALRTVAEVALAETATVRGHRVAAASCLLVLVTMLGLTWRLSA